MEFTTTDAEAKPTAVKMLVYAPAGYGKTMLAATLPAPIIVSIEKGLLSLNAANQRAIYGVAFNIPVLSITNYADLDEAYNFIKDSPHARQFESVALDSVSDIAETVLAARKASNKDPRKAYGEMQDKMWDLIRRFRDLPNRHVYMTAKQDREQEPVSGAMLYGPSMPGKKLTQDIGHYFDEVFALCISPKDTAGNNYRYLRTRADVQFQAKDRSGALDEIEQPNLGHIIRKIQSHVAT